MVTGFTRRKKGKKESMPEVRLGRFEVEKDLLPMICMRCGAPATLRKKKQFTWYPSWVSILLFAGVLPYIIVVRIMMKKMRVSVPLCDAHSLHFIWGTVVVPLTLLALIVFTCGIPFTLGAIVGGRIVDDIMGLLCLSFGAGLVAWFIAMVVVNEISIHPTEITDNSITLKGVAESFADAVGRQRVAAPPDVIPMDEPRSRPALGGEQFFDPRS
jgi:hypothetical protein